MSYNVIKTWEKREDIDNIKKEIYAFKVLKSLRNE